MGLEEAAERRRLEREQRAQEAADKRRLDADTAIRNLQPIIEEVAAVLARRRDLPRTRVYGYKTTSVTTGRWAGTSYHPVRPLLGTGCFFYALTPSKDPEFPSPSRTPLVMMDDGVTLIEVLERRGLSRSRTVLGTKGFWPRGDFVCRYRVYDGSVESVREGMIAFLEKYP